MMRQQRRGGKKLPGVSKLGSELYGSNKIVDTVDLSEEEDAALIGETELMLGVTVPFDPNFGKTLDMYSEKMRRAAELVKQREDVMVARFETRIEELIAQHPELLDKSQINILCSMGTFHGRLADEWQKQGVEVEKSFAGGSEDSPADAVMRSYMAGRNPEREVVARGYLEDMLSQYGHVRPIGRFSGDDYSLFIRSVVEKFGIDDIAQFHNQLANLPQAGDHIGVARLGLLDKIVRQAGMRRWPRITGELHKRAEELRQR